MTNVPVRTPVVLTFSEPLDPATITNDTFTVFANGVEQGLGVQRSADNTVVTRSEEHTSELQSPCNLVCRLLLEKKKTTCSLRLCSTSYGTTRRPHGRSPMIIALISVPEPTSCSSINPFRSPERLARLIAELPLT